RPQRCALLLGFRSDLAGESQLRPFCLFVRRVARVREVGEGRRLAEQRLELRPVGQPALYIAAVQRAGGQLFEVRQKIVPGRVLEGFGRFRQSYHRTPKKSYLGGEDEVLHGAPAVPGGDRAVRPKLLTP